MQPVVEGTRVHTDSAGLLEGMVTIPSRQGEFPAYRAAPSEVEGVPVVLVVQEIFGVHEHIKDVARRLAKLGYFAVAPELYFRQGDVSHLPSIDAIRQVVAKVPDAQVLSDLDACADWAAQQGADGKRLAVTGFCWGGRITWLYAAHQPALKAAVAWYGRLVGDHSPLQPEHPIDAVQKLRVPVLGLYGGADSSIPLESVERMRTALSNLGVDSEIEVYPDAPHAFYADYRPSYRKAAADDAFERLKRWLREHGV
ncbi:MAG: dienelactone hydrolase family protein [Myxococcales bacterium]